MRHQSAYVGHAEAGHGHLAVQRVVPGDLVGRVHILVGIVVVLHLEARLLQALHDVLRSGQSGQTVAHLDALLDAHVVLVVGVVLLRYHPVVAGEATAWLQHSGDLCEGDDPVRRVASGLNLVGGVEVFVGPRKGLEITWKI